MVEIIAGKDRGKRGKVAEVRPADQRVVVGGLNQMKRHVRARQTRGALQAGIITFDAPLHLSNVMLVCTECSKRTRVAHQVQPDGKKARVCKNCGQVIADQATK
jgi:large subunit ribosomal protein L24